MNRHNSQAGLAINSAVIAFTEVVLVWLLVLPGYVPWTQASAELVPFALSAIASDIACQATQNKQPIGASRVFMHELVPNLAAHAAGTIQKCSPAFAFSQPE